MAKKILNVRISEAEEKALTEHAEKTQRTKTEIVREFLRSLKGKK